MPEQHFYRGLDEGDPMTVELPIREVAERISRMNHGVHRFLSYLIDAERDKIAMRVARYRERGDHDVAETAKKRGMVLVDGLVALLAMI